MKIQRALVLVGVGLALCAGFGVKAAMSQFPTSIEGDYAVCDTSTTCDQCLTVVAISGGGVECKVAKGAAGGDTFGECVHTASSSNICTMHLSSPTTSCTSVSIWDCGPGTGYFCHWSCACSGDPDETWGTGIVNTVCS